LTERGVENTLNQDDFNQACLLCSEDEPELCHRNLVAQYQNYKWGGIEILHLPIKKKLILF
jgi:hypothetical protein